MGAMAILSRLLTPEDYGLLGMVTVITGFAQLFKDLGLSAATIQRGEITQRQVSTLFWINVATGCTIALLVASLSSIVASFYKEPRLVGITLVLSSNFIIGSFSSQHVALLRRQMRFSSLARVDIISTIISLTAGVILASRGANYWALVLMQVLSAISNTVGIWITCSWRPGLPSRHAGIGSMIAFGSNLTGFRCFNYLSRNLDNFLIGRYLGPQSLGLYAKAYQLLLLPINQINTPVSSIAISALSSLQTEPDKYREFYRKAILAIATLGMPVVALMFASADKVILILLGQQWVEVVSLFRLLAPAAFVGTFNVATGWVYQSLGRTDRQFFGGIFSSLANVLIFLISVRWGAIGIAAAYGLSQPLFVVPAIIYCYKETPLRLMDLVISIYRPAIASIGAAAILIVMQQLPIFLNNQNLALGLLVDCIGYALLYISIWLMLPNGRATLSQILQTIQSLKTKKKLK
jgi:O-antigen/teichoic acid export membrane protein